MSLPAPVRSGVREALSERGGRRAEIVDVRRVGGGCINPSARLETADGLRAFVKWNADPLPGMFPAEARGLEALAAAESGLRIPGVWGVDEPGDGPAWLLLEWLPERPAPPDFGRRLGTDLAALHRDVGGSFGWREDNWIGSLPQENGREDSWTVFWRERRLEPQLRRAVDRGFFDGGDRRAWDALLRRLGEWLDPGEAEGPSLLHGDLWSGNVHPGPDGEPVAVDPAVYRGHREVDLAMTELFGGFPASFLTAYREAWPLEPGYGEVRRHVYQLYPLLVHVNLFGAGYVGRTMDRVRRLVDG